MRNCCLQVWDSSEACFQHLKAAGYFIAATHLAPDSIPLADLDWTQPTVVVMGNESFGEPFASRSGCGEGKGRDPSRKRSLYQLVRDISPDS